MSAPIVSAPLPGVDGTAAVVTGGGQGIGAAYARTLAAGGARVACLDLDGERADQTASAIVESGGRALGIQADVTDAESMERAAERISADLGPIRHLIANAGIIGPTGPTVEADLGLWRKTLEVNITGVFLSVKAFAPDVCAQRGTMLLASSVSGLRGWTDSIAYHASKHAVIGLMRSWANEYAPHGVRVNAVCPGWVDTAMIDVQADGAGISRAEAEKVWSRDQLIERFVQPSEVANAAAWLCSDWASMVTAIALPVDGGLLERTNP